MALGVCDSRCPRQFFRDLMDRWSVLSSQKIQDEFMIELDKIELPEKVVEENVYVVDNCRLLLEAGVERVVLDLTR